MKNKNKKMKNKKIKRPKKRKNKQIGKKIDIHSLIEKLPKPSKGWVLPNHHYTGPGNPLHKQLDLNDKPKKKYLPYNKIDKISMKHDICYRDSPEKKRECDKAMLQELSLCNPSTYRERFDKFLVKNIIQKKYNWNL